VIKSALTGIFGVLMLGLSVVVWSADLRPDTMRSEEATTVPDEDPAVRAELSQALHELDGLAAGFRQQISDAQGRIVETSTGQVRLARPDFRWEVNDPFPQIILTDGDSLKIYDPDLEQLTIRPLQNALQDTPLALLTRNNVVLGNRFAVFRAGESSFDLKPTSPDALFANIQLTFDADRLTRLVISDHLGQQTQIEFEQFLPSSVIQSSDFILDVPPETDVIGG
jgi:outer membrane lipoprotein carrier protein